MSYLVEIIVMIIWAALPSFFWFRGYFRGNESELLVGALINLIMMLVFGMVSYEAKDIAGYWFLGVGSFTLILGTFMKTIPFEKLSKICTTFMLLGIFLLLLL